MMVSKDSLLPLPRSGKKIAVIGLITETDAVVHGGGSGSVIPSYIATPLAGISSALATSDLTSYDGTNATQAAAVARDAEAAIVFVGTYSHEGGP